MSEMNLCRRNLLKAGAAAAAGIMASAAANAGIPAAKVEKYDEEYDVVIIGSGFAGMACALKAGRAGKKVLMLEKMPVVGGNSAICGGNVACPVNPVQKAQGIKDSRELFIADCLKDGLGLNHVELLSKIVDRCNDTIKFVEDCGAEFVPNHMLFEGGHSVPRSYEIKAGTGSGYIHPMYDQIKKLSNVTVKTRAKFDDFIMDGDAVVGVTYREGYRFNAKLQSDDLENKTGKTKTVRAKLGVMLAAGGFSRDIWFRQIQDPRVVPTTDSTNQLGATAGVLVKSLGIGAAPVQLCWLQFLPYTNPREKGFGVSVNFTNHACMDFGIVVDRKTGKRFMDENNTYVVKARTTALQTLDNQAWVIVDSECPVLDKVIAKFDRLHSPYGKADTIEELCKQVNLPEKNVVKEVKAYNDALAAGKLEEMVPPCTYKKPHPVAKAPFYAVPFQGGMTATFGGPLINTKAEIQSLDGGSIPGLYAAGNAAGGIFFFNYAGGAQLGAATVYGRIAGRELANRAKQN